MYILKWSVSILKSSISTGYLSNSTSSSATKSNNSIITVHIKFVEPHANFQLTLKF
jgi:hypothetical protein